MITCKEDLINTYIENDHGELRDLYIKKAIEFGFSHQGYRDRNLDWYNLGFIGICEGWGNDRLGQSMVENEKINDYECKKLTLSDLKPRTRTEYEKVTESIFDLRDEFERGELYCKFEHAREYTQITNAQTLSQALHRGYCYRLVEKEIDWRDESHGYLANKTGFHWSTPIAEVINDESDCFLELCRVTLRANGEIE